VLRFWDKVLRKLSTAGTATLLWNAWPDAHKSEAFGRVYIAAVFGEVSQTNRGLGRGGYHVDFFFLKKVLEKPARSFA
jgi:hypothetical protein